MLFSREAAPEVTQIAGQQAGSVKTAVVDRYHRMWVQTFGSEVMDGPNGQMLYPKDVNELFGPIQLVWFGGKTVIQTGDMERAAEQTVRALFPELADAADVRSTPQFVAACQALLSSLTVQRSV